MPATLTAPPKPQEVDAATSRSTFTRIPIEISFEGGDITKPRYDLINYDVGLPEDLVQPGFLVSQSSFEVELMFEETPEQKGFFFSRDSLGLPRLQWLLITDPLDPPLKGARLLNEDRWCTLFWEESDRDNINASILAVYLLDYDRLLLRPVPLGIGYIPESWSDVRLEAIDRLRGKRNPPAIDRGHVGAPDLTLKAQLRGGSIVYELFHYKSWPGVAPEPFCRIRKYPFTFRFVAEDFKFQRQGNKPAIDWWDSIRKEQIPQPDNVEVGDLDRGDKTFSMTWTRSGNPALNSFFIGTNKEGLVFDPTVVEDEDANTGPN